MKKQAVLNEEVKNVLGSLKEKDHLKISDKQSPGKALFYIAFGFITGLFPQSYILSPFVAAATASARSGYAFLTFCGAVIGLVTERGISDSIRLIITLCFVLASREITERKFQSLDKTIISAVFTGIIMLISDFLDMITVRLTVWGLVLCISDSLLSACAVYFFSKSISAPLSSARIRRLSGYDAVCISLTAAILAFCISRIEIGGVYISHIPACLIIIFFSLYARAAGGSISGILFGLVLSVGAGTPEIFYVYAAGGLAAGVFSFLGQYACAASFVIFSCAAAFIGDRDSLMIITMAECAVSGIMFMMIPPGLLSRLEDFLTKSGAKNDNEINMQVALSLKDAARTVGSISDVVSDISDKMNTVVNPELSRTFARIQHNVCAGCDCKGICWNECFDSTIKDVQQIAKLRLKSQKVTPEKLSGGLAGRCQRIRKLSEEVDRDYKKYVDSMDSKLKIDEMRSVVSDQFSSMAQLLYDVSSYLADEKIYDENKSRSLRRVLRENKISVESTAYRENSFSRATVEVVMTDEPARINSDKIRKIISSELKRKFREAEISVEDLRTILTFRQRAEFETTLGIKQIPCEENAVCGDSAKTFDTQDGCTVAVISDGMGTGRRAALDADMTSTIMNRLLSSGFTFRSALRLANSALLIKSGEESLSTVDALCVNPYNAVCTFYKAGAAASYIRHGERVYVLEKPSLPVGILRNIDFAEEECRLQENDIVLMISDGVKGEDDKWIKETLVCWSTDNMQELATHIADRAKKRNEKEFPDDITVIAVKIKKRHR